MGINQDNNINIEILKPSCNNAALSYAPLHGMSQPIVLKAENGEFLTLVLYLMLQQLKNKTWPFVDKLG